MPKLRQRALGPAAMAHGGDGACDALGLLLAELPRREAKAVPEGAAEMRGIGKAVAVGDFGDRMMRFGRVGEIGPGALQAPLPDVMREIVAAAFEQFLQITLRDALCLRDARRRQLAIPEIALDDLADAVQDRRRGRAAAFGNGGRELLGQRKQKIGEALGDRVPLRIREGVQGLPCGIQRTREQAGETLRHDGVRLDPSGAAGLAAAKSLRRHMQGNRAHVALKQQRPVPAPRQHEQMSGRDDLIPARAQHRAVLDGQERGRQRVVAVARQRCHALRSRGKLGQGNAPSIAPRGGGVSGIEGWRRERLQADRAQHVAPRLGAVLLGIGFTRERTNAHAPTHTG